jgi:hypothetical protein
MLQNPAFVVRCRLLLYVIRFVWQVLRLRYNVSWHSCCAHCLSVRT